MNSVHSTSLGVERIKKGLGVNTNDIVEYCKKKIMLNNSIVSKRGKNYYVETDGIIITINSHSYTIITAHKLKK